MTPRSLKASWALAFLSVVILLVNCSSPRQFQGGDAATIDANATGGRGGNAQPTGGMTGATGGRGGTASGGAGGSVGGSVATTGGRGGSAGTTPGTGGLGGAASGGSGGQTKVAQGQSCKLDSDCTTGHCVGGLCCDTACTGACTACSNAQTISSPDGTCAPVGAGKKDPQGGCLAESTTCGRTGFCDGKGQCENRGTTTSCGAASCGAGSFTPAAYCDGKGACGTVTARDCKGYSCTVAGGCAIACTTDTECTGGYCAAMASGTTTRSCATKKADGATCGGDNECVNAHCVGGICCQSACATKCYACSKVATGQDDGLCKPISAGGSSQGMCTASGGECGQTTVCDGNGGCQFAKQGTSCGTKAPACATTTMSSAAPVCSGAGSCSSPSSQSCGNYICNAQTGTCKQACTGDGDCVSGYYCNGGACMPKKAASATCSVGTECGNGICSADGHCCNSACSGGCFSCTTGTCAAKNNNPQTNYACGNACLDLTSDPKNCGSCGHDCGGGSCSGGQCLASCSGATPDPCGATLCTNKLTDKANCGTCGHACMAAPSNASNVCVGGQCDFTCNGGLTKCSGACVNTSTDTLNCGGCGKPCAGTCQSGVCCTGGKTNCGGTCVDLTCDCGGTTTCTNGTKGACAITKVTMYRDADGDGGGDPKQPAQVCPGTSGYVLVASDCDDGNPNINGGYSQCLNSTTRRYCADGGNYANETCPDGCQYNDSYGFCRAGTIGIAGTISCWSTGSSTPATCSTSVGCTNGSCGSSASPGKYRCDGPNDCPGQTCCAGSDLGGSFTRCVDATSCDGQSIVCDPLGVSPCQSGYHCPANGIQLVTCQPN